MNLYHDYIIAEQANMIDMTNITKQIKCVFIGTKNYFFAIPFNMVDFQVGYTHNTTETIDMYYEGMPLQEFLLLKVTEPGLTVEAFEDFVVEQNFNGIQLMNIHEEIDRFKVQANFWGSAIIYNKTARRVGWKPFVLKYKKEKQAVKDFYQDHAKYVVK